MTTIRTASDRGSRRPPARRERSRPFRPRAQRPPAAATDFEPFSPDVLRRVAEPLHRLFSPVAIGLEHVPRKGAVLLAGNHTLYGLIDIPMLGLELLNGTGRLVRGLADHNHFAVPVWRDVLRRLGAVRGTREACAELFERGEAVLVFPGGGREVMKRKGERYKLVWKERIGFAHLAIRYGVAIVPFASVGVDDMFEIVVDAAEILRSPVGELLRVLGITRRRWFRGGEVIPPLARGKGPAGLPRFERQYFLFGPAIETKRYAGRHEDAKACYALRREVQQAIEMQIADLLAVQSADPERYPVQRLLRRIAARLGS
jgi:1-acyl-sn-glycerol-3-phosphate acyltransferase